MIVHVTDLVDATYLMIADRLDELAIDAEIAPMTAAEALHAAAQLLRDTARTQPVTRTETLQ